MFLGHFGAAFAAKRVAPRPSLGTAVLAAQWADGIWPIFVMLGIEQVAIRPGITVVTPLDFVSYPYSHSLAADVGWAALFAVAYGTLRKDWRGAAWLAALEGELSEAVNMLGIGPQGLGGDATAFAVHVEVAATHITMNPVAVNMQCHSARRASAVLTARDVEYGY